MPTPQVACSSAPSNVVDPRQLTLAIGIIAHPRLTDRRIWLRRAAERFSEALVAQRFIVGCVKSMDTAVSKEAEQFKDLVFVTQKDGLSRSCVAKSFAWWREALTIFPAAAFIAKTDDDSLNHLSNLAALLTPQRTPISPSTRSLIYGGWAQFSSYLPLYNRPCGWSFGQRGAAAAAKNVTRLGGPMTNCHFCVDHPFCYVRGHSTGIKLNSTIIGPYIFAAGALELLSAPLVRLVFSSGSTNELVRRASSEVNEERHPSPPELHGNVMWTPWTCSMEDNFVGVAVHMATSAVNAAVDFWLLGGLVEDAHDKMLKNTTRLEPLLTVHKLELDADRLQAEVHKEERANAYRQMHAAKPWNETHRKWRMALMTRLKPKLEALNQSAVAPPRKVHCTSYEEAMAGRAQDLRQPCTNRQGHDRYCRQHVAMCKSPVIRELCKLSCGVCTMKMSPSISGFFEGFDKFRSWRLCDVLPSS